MSTITRERLRERAREKVKSLEFAVTQTAFADSRLELEEELELARIALASLEADAVYFVEIEDGQDINAGRIEGKNRPDLSLLPDGINHLYTATPAPANVEPVAWLWSNRKHPSEVTLVRPEDDEKAEGAHWSGWSCKALYAEPPAPVSVPDDEQCKPHPVMAVKGELGFLDHFDRIISERDEDIDIGQLGSSNYEALMLAALDAFRASMPQGSEPVTKAYKLPFEQWLSQQNDPIDVDCGCVTTEAFNHWLRVAYEAGNSPDGWVACSERMPEVGVKVLCFPVNDEPIHATYNGQLWLQDISWSTSDEPIDNVISCNVFHWMPLPNPPQE